MASTKSASRPKYLSLQAGRAFAAVLVVFYHAGHFLADPERWNDPRFFHWFGGGAFGVQAFFVLSGMVIFLAHFDDIGRPQRLASYLWKRFRRIYPIYWVVLALTILEQSFNARTYEYRHDPLAILSAILLIKIHPEYIVGVAWTLHHEIMFYLVFASAILNRWLGIVLLSVWFSFSLFHLSDPTNSLSLVSPMHLLFGMGIVGAWLLLHGKVHRPALWLFLGSLLFWGNVVYQGVAASPLWLPVTAGFAALLAFLGAARLERLGRLRTPSWLAFLGDASYSIYLIHYMALSKISGLAFHLNTRFHWPIYVWFVLFCFLGTFFGCLLHFYIERPLLKWLGRPGGPLGREVTPALTTG
jgi:peptidoglycan/LPS O-acetylase OafA/YrhL